MNDDKGWQEELCRYLKDLPSNIEKETDIIKWWRVCCPNMCRNINIWWFTGKWVLISHPSVNCHWLPRLSSIFGDEIIVAWNLSQSDNECWHYEEVLECVSCESEGMCLEQAIRWICILCYLSMWPNVWFLSLLEHCLPHLSEAWDTSESLKFV